MRCFMAIKIGSWLISLVYADRVSGLERVTLEVHKSLAKLRNNDESLFGVLPNGHKVERGFPKHPELNHDFLIKSKHVEAKDVDVLWLNSINPTGFIDIYEAKKSGLRVVTPIFDLFPLQYPEFFIDDSKSLGSFKFWLTWILRISDVLVFTSKSQLELFKTYGFEFHGNIEVIELGASIDGPVFPSVDRDKFALLAVSTIEPRKCYNEILDAFDILCALGFPVTLDIVGRYGWKQENVRARILEHSEFGRSLRWHQNCSDQELEGIYRRTSVSIIASVDEGWGIALEEGLRHGHKLVVRDIPIFKQRKNTNIYYFKSDESLAEKISSVFDKSFKKLENRRTMSNFTEEVLLLMRTLK